MDEGLLFSMTGIEITPEPSGELSQSCKTGQLAEMWVATEAARRGYGVFFPIGHAHKADIVLWMPPNNPITVQVKKATYQHGGGFKFMVGSGKPSCARNPNDYGLRYTPYVKGDFDFLCAFIEERNEVVFYRLDEIAGKSCVRWHPHEGRTPNNWDILKN